MSSKMCELLYKNIFGAFQIVSGLKKKLNFFIGGWASLIQSSVIIIVQDFFQVLNKETEKSFQCNSFVQNLKRCFPIIQYKMNQLGITQQQCECFFFKFRNLES